jgi:multicomponent Na+:H+ antiporter subunit G
MSAFIDIIGAVLVVLGTVFLALGGLGLIRMPDAFNRIQVGTKTTTLGTMLTLGGVACLHPDWSLKLLLICLFMLFTNPLSSQVLARAAHRRGQPQSKETHVDLLPDETPEQSGDSS